METYKAQPSMRANILPFLMIFTIIACSDDRAKDLAQNCQSSTLISQEQYESATASSITINSLDIIGDCLKVNFSSSGCNGDKWEVQLIDSGDVLESFPPQRNLKLSLENKEDCQSYITKEITFDVSNLQVDGNQVKLNFPNSEIRVMYEY